MKKRALFAVLMIIVVGAFAVVFGERILSSASVYLFGMRACQPDSRLIYMSNLQAWNIDEKGAAQQISIQNDLPESRMLKSPNRRYIAYSVAVKDNQSALYVACADGSQAYAVTSPHVEVVFSWLNAETLEFAYAETYYHDEWASQAQSFTIDVVSKQARQQENPFQYPLGQYVINPNNANLAAYSEKEGGGFWLANRQAGTKVKIASVPVLGTVHLAQWSPDGGRLAFVLESVEPLGQAGFSTKAGIYVFEVGSGQTRQVVDLASLAKDQSAAELQWSPDSRSLAFTVTNANHEEGNALYALSLGDGNAINLGVKMTMFHSFVWSPDSRQIAFISDWVGGPNQKDVFVISVSTKQVNQLTNSPGFKSSLSW